MTGGDGSQESREITVKTPAEVTLMRAACKLARQALDFAGSLAKASVSLSSSFTLINWSRGFFGNLGESQGP